jgi:Glycosyl hydrolase family 81 C-terminal domain
MVPLMPFSPLTRSRNFVAEEWNTYFSDGKVAQAAAVQGGWRGILYANLAIIDPTAAFNFFNQQNFDPSWLDGGASRTWYLAFAAGMFQTTMTRCSITDIFHRSGRSTLSEGGASLACHIYRQQACDRELFGIWYMVGSG